MKAEEENEMKENQYEEMMATKKATKIIVTMYLNENDYEKYNDNENM